MVLHSTIGKTNSLTKRSYTASGMAAISALLLAYAQEADLLVLQGSYSETLEFVEGYAHHLRLVPLRQLQEGANGRTCSSRILLLDFRWQATRLKRLCAAVAQRSIS